MLNLFELMAVIKLSTSGFTNGLKEASDSMQSFGDRVSNLAAAAGKAVTTGLELASAAAIKFGKDSVDVGKQFDAAMANVAAISGATGKAFDDLREKAIEMGGSTRFSATEASEALGYMAMAGWKPQQMMDGLKGVMDLAAASGEDLARVSDIVTDALTAFGLKAEDSAHFADVLAVASSAANTNVSMMGETFKYVAPLAGTLGYNIEDMAVSIGLMANAGIKASQAGTSLRAGLSKLVKPTDDAISKLKELGLTVQDMSDEEIATKTAALEQSVTAREKAYSDEEEALQDSLDKQYDALKKSLDARYNATKETYDSEYDALKKSLDKQYDAQKEAFDSEYDEHKKALDKSYDAAKDTYDRQYEERKKSLEAEYDALEKALDDEVSQVQKSQEAQVKEYEAAAEAKIASIDEIYKESLKNTNEEEYRRLQALDNQIAAIQAESDAAATAAEQEERAQRRAELQKAINTADSAEKRREAEQKLANYNESIRRKDAETKRKADIADLKAQKDAVKEEAKAARDAAKETRDAEVKNAKEASAAGLEALKAQQKDELEEKKKGRKEQLDAAKEANAQELKELKALNDWRLSTLKEMNESDLKELKKSHAEQLDALKESNADKLDDLKKAHSDQLSEIKSGNEEKLKEAKKGYARQLSDLKEAHKEQLKEYQDSVKQQVAELKKQGEARAAVLTDENGNTRDFIEVVELLRDKFSGMSEAEKTSAAAAIFGQEAMSGWLAMINASDEDFEKLVAQIDVASVSSEKFAEEMKANGFNVDAMRDSMARLGVTQEEFDAALKESNGKVDDFKERLQKAADSGTTLEDIENNLTISGEELDKVFNGMSAAAIMAGTHEDSLAGSTTTLDSAVETLRIRISDKLTPALREFTQFGQDSVVSLTKAFEYGESMHGLSDAIRDTEGNLLSAGQIAGVLSETLYSMSESDRQIAIKEIFGTDDIEYVNSLLDENGGKWDELLEYVPNIDAVSESVNGLSGMMDALAPIISDGIGKILEYLPNVVTIGGQLLGALVTGIIDNLPLLLSGIGEVAVKLGEQLLEAAPDIAAKGGELLDFLADGIIENVDMLADTAINVIDTFAGFLADAIPSVAEKLTDVVVSIAETLSDPNGLNNLAQSAITIIEAIANALITNVPRLGEAALNLLQSFGGMLVDNAGALVDVALNLINMLAGFIGEGIPRLAEAAIDVIVSFASALSDPSTLENLAASAGTIIEGIVTAILDGLPRLAESASEVMRNFGEYLRDNLPEILKTGLEMLVSLSGSIRENAGKLVDAGLDLLLNLAKGFADSIPTLIENVPTIISNIAGVINDNAPKIIATGVQIIWALIVGIVQAIPTLIAEFPKILKAIFDVWTAFNWINLGKSAIDFVKNGIETLKTEIPEAIKNIANTAKEWFANIDWAGTGKSAIEFIKNGINFLLHDIPNALKNIATTAVDWFKGIDWLDAGKGIVNFIKNGIQSLLHDIPEALKQIAIDAKNKFLSVDWLDVGKNLLKGIWDGITGWAGEFFGNITGFVGEIMDKFTGKDGFDENSPSKWSAKVFQNVLEGGEIGLDKGLPGILSSAESAVRDIQDALSADPFHVSGGYDLSGGYSFSPRPQLAAATASGMYGQAANPVPVEFTVVNELEAGGVKFERRQVKYRVSEDKRRGATLVKL